MTREFSQRARFDTVLREIRTHIRRLRQAEARSKGFFPLTRETYAALTDDQVEHVDQLVYRFAKLQDALGAKLFPLINTVRREDAAALTMYDVLSDLEKAGAIPAADRWLALREVRNALTHDYGDDPDEGSRTLNELLEQAQTLIATAEQVDAFVRERVLPSLPE